jgi:hypothetical protein
MACRRTSLGLILLALSLPLAARADDVADEARVAFNRGTELVVEARWAEALAAFERAQKLRAHAVTSYNIGACERALGRYTRARVAFLRALRENDEASGAQLSESLVEGTKGYLAEIDKLLAKVTVTLVPAQATVLVDGRPLAVEKGAPAVLVAGVRAPGAGESPPSSTFTLLVDPGVHVFLLARAGYSNAVVNRTFMPGASTTLKLELDKLPATLQVVSDRDGALVTIDGVDLGPAPVDALRPAGTHRVVVTKAGYVGYDHDVQVAPGEVLRVQASLVEDKPALTQRWWFWTATAVVVAGVAVGTYVLTRPEPSRGEVNGGTLGWKIAVP